ncbi:MAG: hypothetical protein A3G81_10525 [Betaproteobacteria bacterium RIFCSPLOWO2_12_FULL_65_14]|nr:MAG: hypothetical protein A3G81_10525 [Betaproteobacteria bacterium RIFCSPLOWO2_12_FULL_65_14]
MEYLVVKWLHVLSSTVLFGTGLGSAFYMFTTNRSGDVRAIAVVARRVVIADWLFTAPTAVLQPLTGFWLVYLGNLQWTAGWILWSLVLYVFAGACWLPVVWIQIRMAAMAERAAASGEPLPPLFWRYHAIWTSLGWPAFIAFIAIFYLMVVRPAI